MNGNRYRTTLPRAAAQEMLSPAEELFERWRHTLGFFFGPLVAAALYAAPMPSLAPSAHRLAAVLGWVVTWWVTEPIPIPITALIGALLCVVSGIAPAKAVFAPFADPIIFLFLGSFILAEAMAVHGLDRRFAFKILTLKWVGNSTGRILFAYGAITAGLSAWISNTATAAMMFPIGLGIIYAMADMMERKKGADIHPARLRYGTGMMLMAAYAASVGGIATPVGTPPNLIGIGMIEKLVRVKIPFFQWMLFAIPIMITLFAVLYFVLYRLYKPEVASIEGSREFVQGELRQLGDWSRGEKNALIAFLVTVVLWVTPGFLAVFFGTASPLFKSYNEILPEAAAAIIGAALLFVLPVNWSKRQFTITWKQASSIDWGTLLLFGGGLTLGNLMFETKLADAIGSGILTLSGTTSQWGITFVAIVMAAAITEVTSNTAAANMVVPVVISLALAAGVNPIPPAIGASLGASLAFMLPVSTPPNAIVYGSGMVPITRMIRAGIFFDLLSIGIIWIGLRIMLPLVGLG
jgi:solute carrier family 13 (sodium-dependent dicarboxylate transporter), member 2/3/5